MGGPRHKCPQTVSLHAMEEVWSFLSDDQYEHLPTEEEEIESTEEALAISVQAMKGTEGSKSFRLRGFWANQEVYMLVDSGSTNCLISEHLAAAAPGKIPLQQLVTVRVANGYMLLCTHELPDQLWCILGVTFKTSFKILPLNCYDMILGMDWLVGNSPMEIHWAEK